ncbi:MAG: exonuclease domain-containing protein [Bacteroidetes bacterium]|jgi:DNA polymerase-3 subunit epsilon|nr:exonuclease domain-containing protein [Bacteroidota bacterium]
MESNQQEKRYAIVDVETTGLKAGQEKITEIAVVLHDGNAVLDTFSTLINPEKKIPYRITQLTGINDQMVAGAPRFYEVAKQLVEITDSAIFVGHNVSFDYRFIQAEFKSLGYDFKRQTLDTVKLSRKLIPGLPSYSLGKLCQSINIKLENRHRALGDAMATARLFEMLCGISGEPEKLSLKGTHANLNPTVIEKLPEAHGVYYFFDFSGKLIYVGKSVNIKSRVLQHLSNNSTRRAIEMKQNIADVDYRLTGNELVALLLESDEIKKQKPLYNRAQRRSLFNYGLYHYEDEKGYHRLRTAKTSDKQQPHYTYATANEARAHLFMLTERFQLCQGLNGLYPGNSACFQYQIGQCKGACCGQELPETYNLRVQEALDRYHFDHENFLIVEEGIAADQKAVVKIQHGVYKGFGFVPVEFLSHGYELADDCITTYPDNRDVRQIIQSYMRKHPKLKIIPFDLV